ncbi:MAG: hypothetical protein C5B60_01560 [Chloroflexi bacterium]|nr:MAG: hypothetical protein C5B60_01560 [Chloroflexota bacterium]
MANPSQTTQQQAVVTKSSTPPPLPGTPHYQGHGAENRLSILSVNYNYGTKSTKQVVTPNMTDMQNLANTILAMNGKPALPHAYAPNEAASLVHILQTNLGI